MGHVFGKKERRKYSRLRACGLYGLPKKRKRRVSESRLSENERGSLQGQNPTITGEGRERNASLQKKDRFLASCLVASNAILGRLC